MLIPNRFPMEITRNHRSMTIYIFGYLFIYTIIHLYIYTHERNRSEIHKSPEQGCFGQSSFGHTDRMDAVGRIYTYVFPYIRR